MRKTLLLCFILVMVGLVLFVSCTDEAYSSVWNYDETYHWHELDSKVKDKAEHSFIWEQANNKIYYTCSVCSYIQDDKTKTYSDTDVVLNITKEDSALYQDLNTAINEATAGDTLILLRDIDISETMTAGESAGVSIAKSLTLDGNGHKIYNNSELKTTYPLVQIGDTADGAQTTAIIKLKNLNICNYGVCDVSECEARLMNIWSMYNTSGDESPNATVILDNVNFYSKYAKGDTYFRGISLADNAAPITLNNVTVDIPHYYAIYIGYSADRNTKMTINNSTIKGWASIYNKDSNLKLEANNSTFVSVNSEITGGDSNSFSCIIVSEYNKFSKSENNEMTFNKCIFEVSKTYESSDVDQHVADLRNPCNNTLNLNNCKYAPAKGSQYFTVCYNDNGVADGEKGTNKINVDGEDITCSDFVVWGDYSVSTTVFKITYKNTEDASLEEGSSYTYWYYRYDNKDNNEVTLPTLTKDGYTFGGWYTDEAFTEANKISEIQSDDGQNYILYAQWTKIT